jgi:hypothetical protein
MTGNQATPQRLLVLKRYTAHPQWHITFVSDVRPAAISSDGRFTDWRETESWVREQLGPATMITAAARLPLVFNIYDRAPSHLRGRR